MNGWGQTRIIVKSINEKGWLIAGELGITTERLHKLRYEGFYEELHWEQIQRLAKLLTMRSWELVRLVEEGHLPDEIDSQQLIL